MASNRIPKVLDPLIALAEDAADGATTHGPAIGLKQNTALAIRTDLGVLEGNPAGDVGGKQPQWLLAKAAKASATTAKQVADSNAKAFIAGTVGWLKNHLGQSWNAQWEAVGFTGGSLAVPTSADERFALLPTLAAYFQSHADHELVSPVDGDGNPTGPHYTQADAVALHTTVSDTRAASLASNTAAGTAKAARDAAFDALHHRLSGLLGELDQLLGDDDPRWYAFGFSRPGDPETPQVPENVVLTPGGAPGRVLVDWDDARRAERYKGYWKIAGSPADPTLGADNVEDSDATLTALPTGQTIEVTITAVNEAGESLPSAPITIVVP